ncbi:pyocin S6 family toxin immunity protein [Pseudomonas yamanorum]|uniref:pyocin S6 family toxin immunity protein n=1 Tax=Pseudomonas yamanorum TaxID=515393 RepID=UPI00210A81D4|nr:pyocin S6 family toxin immunity protein [Pseudomonas yamanorum]
MANNKDIPQVWRCYGTGTGGYRKLENMNERELADREARQRAYEAMLARQEAYEARRKVESPPTPLPRVGCVFAKSCNLPDALIDYNNPSGYIPLDRIGDYGEHVLLGGRETDSEGVLPLKKKAAELNQAAAQLTESKPLENLAPGELELTKSQIAQLAVLLNINFPDDLEYFIGVRA